MNLENVMLNMQTQGPAFWAAALAVALGATLLVVSVMTQFRRLLISTPKWRIPFGIPGLKRHPKPSERGYSLKHDRKINKTEDGYQPSSVSPLSPGPSQKTGLQVDSGHLTARLRLAANTLEEIQQRLRQDNFTPGFSVLKHEAESVDYHFKTTTV